MKPIQDYEVSTAKLRTLTDLRADELGRNSEQKRSARHEIRSSVPVGRPSRLGATPCSVLPTIANTYGSTVLYEVPGTRVGPKEQGRHQIKPGLSADLRPTLFTEARSCIASSLGNDSRSRHREKGDAWSGSATDWRRSGID